MGEHRTTYRGNRRTAKHSIRPRLQTECRSIADAPWWAQMIVPGGCYRCERVDCRVQSEVWQVRETTPSSARPTMGQWEGDGNPQQGRIFNLPNNNQNRINTLHSAIAQ